jgi:hypothetical protein
MSKLTFAKVSEADYVRTLLIFDKVAASAYNPSASASSSKPNSRVQSPAIKTAKSASDSDPTVSSETTPPTNGTAEAHLNNSKKTESDTPRSDDGDLKQSPHDDRSTQLSSDDSLKPLSFDTKSVASVATFALDEKESLRPDDSASMRAVPVEEEEMFSPPGSVVAGSRVGSDTGAKAFREQLHEIAYMSSSAVRPVGVSFSPAILTNPSHAQPTVVKDQIGSAVAKMMKDCDQPVPDEALLEALQSQRDRVWVLKLEQDIIDFIEHSK